MQVTYEKNGVSCYTIYDNSQTQDEIKRLIHRGDVREQYVEAFKEIVHDITTGGDNLLGYALEMVTKKKFFSRISNIQFHNDSVKFNNIKYKQHEKSKESCKQHKDTNRQNT